MRHGSLFSGIGGFDLAAQWMGWENVFQVEWDKWCQKILAKNFPDTLRFGDIVEFNKMLLNGTITTHTEGARLIRKKKLENDSEDNGNRGGCDSSDIHQIFKQNGEIITDTRLQRQAFNEKQTTGIKQCRKNGINIGRIDIITGGFPCQPFSHAGKRKGTDDSRYLWPEMLTTIRILKPSFVVGENVAGLVSMENGKTLDGILSDLANEGYTTEQFIIPACAIGAWHRRDRIWIVAYNNSIRCNNGKSASKERSKRRSESFNRDEGLDKDVPNTIDQRLQGRNGRELSECTDEQSIRQRNPQNNGEYWQSEPAVGRVANGIPNRVDRLKGLGNAIVPQIAFELFKAIEQNIGNIVS